MEFTSFDDLKNLLGSDAHGSKSLVTRSIIGTSIKVRGSQKRNLSNNAQLVINKDTELLQYQYNKKKHYREQNQSTTFQETGKSLF